MLLDIIPSPLSIYNDKKEITNNSVYFYKIKVVNDIGGSNFSNEISAIPKSTVAKPPSPTFITKNCIYACTYSFSINTFLGCKSF